MARPHKYRNVCCLPYFSRFGPLDTVAFEIVNMGVDEYEAIRLIDFEGFTQEECAARMNIARTTVQGIYETARKKLADTVVNGKILHIAGGEYRLCDGCGMSCGKPGCQRHGHGRFAPSETIINNIEEDS